MDKRRESRSLKWIGGFKLASGLLLALVATGVLSCIHKDVAAIAGQWAETLRIDSEFMAGPLEKLGLLNEAKLKLVGILTFIYSAILLTEGIGLLMKKKWAEWLTVVASGFFIPLEVYEIAKDCSAVKLLLLVINVAIVWFLIRALKKQHDTIASDGLVAC